MKNKITFAYQLISRKFNRQIIQGRGPMVAELATGNAVFFHDTNTNQSKEIKAGKYLYIEPGASFYLIAVGTGEINMVLFEIK